MKSGWNAPIECSAREEWLLKLCKKRKMWRFLREHRHRILDDEFRQELSAMYASGSKRAGSPVVPERMALAMLLQVAFDVPDHDVPTLTAVDQRWQMVLDCLGSTEPAFSQGAVFNFRERARANGLMDKLLDKTVVLARETKGFGHARLRAMIDSSPLLGAGRVEDTFNLIGRAVARLVEVAAREACREPAELAAELELSVVGATSVKAALDVDWRLPTARNDALQELLAQFESLKAWLESQFTNGELLVPPLSDAVALVEEFIEQDTEPDPDDSASGTRVPRKGTAKDRRISISDPDMRHGRKSKTKLFNGYKDHYMMDADVRGLVVAADVVPANRPENEGAQAMLSKLPARGLKLVELHADRGYLETAIHLHEQGIKVVTKPPTPSRKDGFGKYDFPFDPVAKTLTCPEGVTIPYRGDGVEHSFPSAACRACPVYRPCVAPKNTFGKRITAHRSETFLRQMHAELGTPDGRSERRERARIEHVMGRVLAIRGRSARFRGLEKVRFDVKRTAVVVNLYILADVLDAAA